MTDNNVEFIFMEEESDEDDFVEEEFNIIEDTNLNYGDKLKDQLLFYSNNIGTDINNRGDLVSLLKSGEYGIWLHHPLFGVSVIKLEQYKQCLESPKI